MGCALPVFLGLLALLAGARPVASRDTLGVPASVLAHQHQSSDLKLDEFSALARNDLSALPEPWLPASSAPAPARGLYTLSKTTSLQAMDTEAGMVKRLRGVGIFGPNIPNELQVFFQNGLKWYYTWSPYSDPASFQMARLYNAEFVPMIWGEKDLETLAPPLNTVPYVKGSYFPSNTNHLLTFNEPNMPSQSNLTSMQAAQLWPQVEAIAKNLGLLIGSPAPAHCGQPDCLSIHQAPFDWFDDFFSNCTAMYGRTCKVDFMAVHYYGCSTTDLQRFMVQVAQVYKKRVWLTEFACGHAGSFAALAKVLKAHITMLDSQPMVARYSWFAAHTQGVAFLGPLCSLLQNSYSVAKLTPIGRIYCTYVAGGQAPPIPHTQQAALEANVRAEVCGSCSDAAANASVAVPELELRGVCQAHCGYRY